MNVTLKPGYDGLYIDDFFDELYSAWVEYGNLASGWHLAADGTGTNTSIQALQSQWAAWKPWVWLCCGCAVAVLWLCCGCAVTVLSHALPCGHRSPLSHPAPCPATWLPSPPRPPVAHGNPGGVMAWP